MMQKIFKKKHKITGTTQVIKFWKFSRNRNRRFSFPKLTGDVMLLKESNNRATTTWSNCKHHKLQKNAPATLNPKPFL